MRSIALKFAFPFLLFLIPVGFVMYFLVATHHKSISMTQNEIAGVPGVHAALGTMHHLVRMTQPETRESARAAARADLEKVRAQPGLWPKDTHLAGVTEVAVRAVEAVLTLKEPNAKTISPGLQAMRQVIRAIGDVSELILDPDLDTYYLMDVLVIHQANIKIAVDDIFIRLEEMAAMAAPGEFVGIGIKTHLALRRTAIMQAFESIKRSTSDPTVIATISSPIEAYTNALQEVESALAGGQSAVIGLSARKAMAAHR